MNTMNKTSTDKHAGLRRYLSPLGAWALGFGCAVGWGAFVMPGTVFLPKSGPLGTVLGMAVGGLIMLLIAVNYRFMMNKFPDAAAPLPIPGMSWAMTRGS